MNPGDLKDLSVTELLAIYNTHAPKQIKRFSSRNAALKQTHLLLESLNAQAKVEPPRQEAEKIAVLVGFSDLQGKTLISISGKIGDPELFFQTSDGSKYELAHSQDCCESVTINDICGDLQDLIGSPIIQAEEVSGVEPLDFKYSQDSYAWTFYKLATIKGYVTIRWLGESNGYYSQSVDFKKIADRVRE